jgi:glyoxylase-like metal-dependent hydrolase (beta-lactamase superfamily II)
MKKYGKLMCLALSLFVVCGGGYASADSGVKVYKMGDIEIIAALDATSERNRELLIGDEARIKQLMPEEKSPGVVSVFAVRTKTSTFLIDAGWGPPRGSALANLAKVGITPDKVDAVLITHLHGDHVSGLLNDGKIVFPNALLYVASAELNYWFSDEEMNKHADKGRFNAARQGISAYGDKVKTIEPGMAIVPEITVVNQYGHTHGHVGYLVQSGNKKLLFWGDLTHFTKVQMADPKIAVRFDTTPKEAVTKRLEILKWAAAEGMFVAGAHIEFPGIGKLKANSDGSYAIDLADKLD